MSTNVTEEDKRYIRQLKSQGYSITDIASFSRRSTTTVRKVLKEEN